MQEVKLRSSHVASSELFKTTSQPFICVSITCLTCSSNVSVFGSPMIPLSLGLLYNVPPSVQILRKVKPVAHGSPASQAAFSFFFNSSTGMYFTSHLLPVCLSNSFRISLGVVVKEFTIRILSSDSFGCVRAATTSLPTLFSSF